MRYHEIINEVTQPRPATSAITFYHGTKHHDRAIAIMREGIQPQNQVAMGRKRNGQMTPVGGMTYVTPNLRYALIYALGGSFVGRDPPPLSHIERSGQYGYLFVVPGSALNAVQPDEDDVGGAVRFAYKAFAKRHADPNAVIDLTHSDNRAFEQALLDDLPFMNSICEFAYRTLTDLQYEKLCKGWEFAICAQAGKKMVAKMSPGMKAAFIEKGCHVAHQGGIMPSACYKIDKTRSRELGLEGEHLLDVAEKVWERPAAD